MGPESFRTPLTLSGRHVELVPLAKEHREGLRRAATDPEIGRYLRHGPGRSAEDMDDLIDTLLRAQAAGTDLPFTTRLLPNHQTLGMTRYLRIDRANQWVEIGGTWLDSAYWRTPMNGETKYLLLRHAFEKEAAHRVEFQTDSRNERSQTAIARLGAVREGVLREDVRLANGYFRSSVHYSVLVSEWPSVKSRLDSFLARPWVPPKPSTPFASD
jgi:RimJ/RimL family protein N-acetyltransferase